MSIAIRKPKELDFLKKSSSLVAKTIEYVSSFVKVGITTKEIDSIAEDFIRSNGGRPSFKGLYGFPGAICTSVNKVIIHGIPDNNMLNNGDILGIDVGVEINGWYGDAAVTVAVGEISQSDQRLINSAKDVLDEAISEIRTGMRFKELSRILETAITSRGYQPLRSYCGHGIGRKPHEEPSILNYVEGSSNQGPKIKDGMVFCIEPMITQENGEAKILEDKWSVVSIDNKNGSHYEHTIAVVGGKAQILSVVE